jgi:calcineurin-like phosphoesterase family protein
MNEAIRDAHNKLVSKDDICFNLGDAVLIPSSCMSTAVNRVIYEQYAIDILSSFNGQIKYCVGNHEKHLDLLIPQFELISPLAECVVTDEDDTSQEIVLCHYGLRSWNRQHYGSWMLHGHSHGSLMDDNGNNMNDHPHSLILDVGVDNHPTFSPYSFSEVKKIMGKKIFKSNDHHKGK